MLEPTEEGGLWNDSAQERGNASSMQEPGELEQLMADVTFYAIPLIVVLGSIGNVLSVLVFFTTKLRKLSSSYYLSALAVSDTGFLCCTLIGYLDAMDVGLYNQDGVCEITTYFAQVFGFLSPWFIVAFTVERFIAVRYPLKRNSMCTVSRAKIVLVSLTTLATAACVPSLFISGVGTVTRNTTEDGELRMEVVESCRLMEGHERTAEILNHLDTIITLIIPFLIIVSLNTLISRTVCRVARVRRSMTKSAATGPAGRGGHQTKQRTASSQTKVTEMLLVVSTVFIVLNLPSYSLRMYIFVNQKREEERALVVLQHLAQLLFYINFGINFALYCVSGQNFRRALVALFCPNLRRRSDPTQVTVVSEYTRSASSRRTFTVNGTWREAHEMVPINRGN